MLRIAVTGSGMLVNEILPVLVKIPEIKIAAIVGTKRSEEKLRELSEKYSINEIFTDFEEMLKCEKEKVDLVYLATPNNTHYELAIKAIEAGYNTFIEKPMVETLKEAEMLYKLAEEKGVFAVEAISNQYLPAFEAIKSNLSRAGQIKYVNINFSQYSSRYDRFMAGEYFKVFDRKAGGGALKDLGIYNIHMAVGLFGIPEKLAYYPNIVKDVDTSGVLMMDYNSFKVTSIAAKDCQGDSGIMIEGTDGYFKLSDTLNSLNAPLIFHDRKKNEDLILEEKSEIHRIEPEFKAIAKMINNNDYDMFMERRKESLAVMKVLEMIKLGEEINETDGV